MRSLLIVPATNEGQFEEALGSGADALILDLKGIDEPFRRDAARQTAANFLLDVRRRPGRPKLFVRVNGLESGLVDRDLAAVMGLAADGIVLPRAEGGAAVSHLGVKLAVHEALHGLREGAMLIVAIAVETAKGLLGLGSLPEASGRLAAIGWSAEGFTTDLGAEPNRDAAYVHTEPRGLARNLTLAAAAAAEVDAIDSPFADHRDTAGLAAACEAARRDGFAGKFAIHPAQVAVINAAFTPSPKALAEAQAVVAAFAAHPDWGTATVGGRSLDRSRLQRAQRILARGGQGT